MKNVAIIGIGNISSSHLDSYLNHGDLCEVKALVDIYIEKAEQRKLEKNLDIDVYENYFDIFDKGIDLVSICTPPHTHKQIAIDCMKAGIDVIIEKPMAQSLEECDEIIKVSNETGRTVSAVAQNRFTNDVLKLKKLLEKDLLGEIVSSTINSYWWRGHCYYDLWWRGTWEKEGGGCTLNHAVHHIDIINWMMGKMPKTVTSVLSNVSHDNAEIEDLSVSILQYDKSICTLTGSVVHHGEEKMLEFQGRDAMVSIPFRTHASISRDNGFPTKNTNLEKEIEKSFYETKDLECIGHEAQILDVLDAITKGREPAITMYDGRNTIELITAIYKSGSTNLPVNLPIKNDDEWYSVDGIIKNAKYFYEKTKSSISLGSNKIDVN